MRKFLRGAVVLLIAIAMFFSTVAIADTLEEKNEYAFIKTTNTNPSNPIIEPALGPVMFSQQPYEPDEDWGFYTSDLAAGYICADDFWDIEEPICDIHWWGLSLFWTGAGWEPCDPAGMVFEIVFYDSAGNPVCSYQVTPPATPTGKFYSGFEMYYWETDLVPCCPLNAGMVSIQSLTSPNGCWFLWAGSPDGNFNAQQNWEPIDPEDNLAFELTKEDEPCEPCIDVEKYVWDSRNQEWVDADTEDTAVDLPICEDVTFKIVIHNCGDTDLKNIIVKDKMHDSLKFISADPEPDEFWYEPPFYYMEWYFPGPLAPCETIELYITAHVEGPECSYDFNYVLVEGEGCGQPPVRDDDYAYVHARKPYRDINTPLLNLLELLMNQFPILKALFGL